MTPNTAVEKCAACPLCKFTRAAKTKSVFYNIARHVQGTCPNCKDANKESGKDMQKSGLFQ